MSLRIRAALVAALCVAAAACTVEQVDEGRAPSVDPGEAPAFEVEPADVDIEWDTSVVRVPDVELTPRDQTPPPGDTVPR